MAAEGRGKHEQKVEYCVLSPSMAGGPQGLGDPDDKFMRHAEHLIVDKMMRDRSLELCNDEKAAFEKCLGDAGRSFFYKCRPPMKKLRNCQNDWYNNKEFRAQMTEEYLNMRTEYRRTGISKQMREEEKKKMIEFEDWIHKQNKMQKETS